MNSDARDTAFFFQNQRMKDRTDDQIEIANRRTSRKPTERAVNIVEQVWRYKILERGTDVVNGKGFSSWSSKQSLEEQQTCHQDKKIQVNDSAKVAADIEQAVGQDLCQQQGRVHRDRL